MLDVALRRLFRMVDRLYMMPVRSMGVMRSLLVCAGLMLQVILRMGSGSGMHWSTPHKRIDENVAYLPPSPQPG